MRNRFVNKTDSIIQEEQPENQVRFYNDESLRIVSDELFHAVQTRLNALKSGPRGPRKKLNPQLWDVVTHVFVCGSCGGQRLHVCGSKNDGMRCPDSDCRAPGMVNRRAAVLAIVDKIECMVQDDDDLQQMIATACVDLGQHDQQAVEASIAQINARIARTGSQISDLQELAGEGSETDRAETKARIRAARAERSGLEQERSVLARQLTGGGNP